MKHESDILDLILTSAGKAAPYMTEKLCKIGDGSMAEGISALTDFAVKSGMEKGEKAGLIKGAALGTLVTFTVLGAFNVFWDFRKKRAVRITALQEADNRIKIADIECESLLADEQPTCCDADNKREDESMEEKVF